MTKTRFTAADVRAMVRDLRSSVLGLRVANVYSMQDQKTFLLKLASPGQEKAMLLLESGVRFHTTKFTHEKSDMPSGFSMKLRKHIRTQRLEDVRQVGMDRVVDFKFGSGKASNHVILELYASGNIILTDFKYEILDLLRTHTYEGQGQGIGDTVGSGAGGAGGGDVRVAVRQIYPMELATTQEGTAAAVSADVEAGGALKNREVEGAFDADEQGEAVGAFVKGMPLEVGVQRMSEWLQRAAMAAAVTEAPPPSSAAAVANGEDGGGAEAAAGGGGKNGKKKGGSSKKPKKPTLKQVLMQKGSGVSVYGPSILDHCVLGAGLRPNAKLAVPVAPAGGTGGDIDGAGVQGDQQQQQDDDDQQRGGFSEDEVRRLVVALGGAEAIVQQLDRPGQQGYIQCKVLSASSAKKKDSTETKTGKAAKDEQEGRNGPGKGARGATAGADDTGVDASTEADRAGKEVEEGGGGEVYDDVVYEDFLPQLLVQHEGVVIHSFPSFDQAVDAFFGRIVEQKLKQTAIAAEAAVEKKVQWIRDDQERRVLALEERQAKMLRHAQLAEAWADEVEKALMVVRSALANGMDWQDLDELVKAETANGNPIASLIHELRLDRNQVVLALPTSEEGEDDQLVEVDIMLSAHANARAMYENKKLARTKELKTLQASEKVLKIAELQAQKTLQRQAHKRSLQVARRVYWFEKFNWFITSENYLVISGRNAQQNEVVVKKYLRPGDIYVHADLHGAASCVVRNKDPSGKRPVSPLALEEAGCMTVCRSGAWGAKMVTSAWWVYADQVSKTAPTGEYLVTGSFMVRGRKHFLPPRALEMGFALLFKLDDSCLAAHAGERREKLANAEDEEEVEEDERQRDVNGVGAMAATRKSGGRGGGGGKEEHLDEDDGDGITAGGGSEHGDRRAVRFDAPVGLDEKRGDNDDDTAGAAANRRAVALAALAGGGGGNRLTWAATWAPPGGRGGAAAATSSAPEATKKRLSAKERKQAKKAGAGYGGGGGKQQGSAARKGDDDDDDDRDMSGGDGEGGGAPKQDGLDVASGFNANANANANASVPRGKRSKLKKMKKKYAEQDEDDRRLAMEALGKSPQPEGVGGGRRRFREGDRKEAAAAEAAAAAAASKNLRKTEAELAATLSSLDPKVREKLGELVKPDDLDPFEVRALGQFNTGDALDILERFAEADLRKVRNRSGFLAGIMRKHGSASLSTTASAAAKVVVTKEKDQGTSTAATLTPVPPPPPADASGEDQHQDQQHKGAVAVSAVHVDEAGERAGEGEGEDEGDQATGQGSETTAREPSGSDGGDAGDSGEGEPAGKEGGEDAAKEAKEADRQRQAESEVEEPLRRRAHKKREEEEIKKLLEEEGDGGEDLDGGDGAAGGFGELDRLTGKPRSDDVIHFAVAVCGPYMSMRDYKYKVKLTPGKQKRGKAAKQAIEVFSRARDTPPSHKGLIKGVTDNECVQAMIGDVKVAVAGLAQATQAKKKANKQSAQRDPKKSSKQKKAKGGKGKK
eukprot:g12284.t1